LLPGAALCPIAAAGISQDEDVAGLISCGHLSSVHRMDNYSVHRMDSYSELVSVQCHTRIGFPLGKYAL